MEISVFQNNRIERLRLENILLNKRILLCSVCRLADSLTAKYVEYLETLGSKFLNQGLDGIYLIDSCNGLFSLCRLEQLSGNLLGMHDHNKEVISWLAKSINKKQPLDQLALIWSYQVLINNGTIEKFYDQPTIDQKRNLVKAKINDLEFIKKFMKYSNVSEDLIFNTSALAINQIQTYNFGGKMF